MSNLKKVSLELEIGQEILVGNNNERAKITKIEYHEKSGEVVLGTTEGTRKALTFALTEAKDDNLMCPADKYR